MVWEADMKRDVAEAKSQAVLELLHGYRVGKTQDRFAVQVQVSSVRDPRLGWDWGKGEG